MDTMSLADLELIANGAYSPLRGFLGKDDYESVLEKMRLINGDVWSIPITLPVSEVIAEKLKIGELVKLAYNEEIYGVLELKEMYTPNKLIEEKKVYQTTDREHPGVKKLFERPNVFSRTDYIDKIPPKDPHFEQYYKSPKETRAVFQTNRWETVVGFQTRNPVHRAHEYIQKTALETVDGLFLNPLVGETKSDDIPA